MVKGSYTLRQVVELTGLSEFTLRGWETRYSAFKPRRSETGRRIYSAQDLEKAMLLRELTNRDYRIGDVANYSLEKLGLLLKSGSGSSLEQEKERESSRLSGFVAKIFECLSIRDWDASEDILKNLAKKEDPLELIRNFVIPVLGELGLRVGKSEISISQEHILSAQLKETLFQMLARDRTIETKARLLVAAPEGDFHELGILSAHVLCSCMGIRSLFLGANSPKSEITDTAIRFRATHLLLGTTISRKEGAKEDLPSLIHFMDRNLPKHIALWIGGRNSSDFRAQPERSFYRFESMADLEKMARALIK